MTESTKLAAYELELVAEQEYLDATRHYRADPELNGYMASVVAQVLTPEQRARVIAIMREEEAAVKS